MIELVDVSKVFQGKNVATEVFSNLNFTINQGDFIAIVGRSGSGKSTLLHIVGLLEQPTSGEVLYQGRDITKLKNKEYARIRNEDIGFVFQDFKLIPDMTVYENIEVPLAFSKHRYNKKQIQAKIAGILKDLGIPDKALAYPSELSGGQQQRVAIARALINDPSILIVDEPTGNLDEQNAVHIMNLIAELHATRNLTILMVTHDDEIKKYAKQQYPIETLLENGYSQNDPKGKELKETV